MSSFRGTVFLGFLTKVGDALAFVSGWLAIASMVVIGVVIPYEVIARFAFNNPPIWSGELAGFALAWASMFGGAVGLRRGYQVGMTFIIEIEMIPAWIAKSIALLGTVLAMPILATFLWYGVIQMSLTTRVETAATHTVLAVPYLCIPLASFFMLWFSFEQFFKQLEDKRGLSAGVQGGV